MLSMTVLFVDDINVNCTALNSKDINFRRCEII